MKAKTQLFWCLLFFGLLSLTVTLSCKKRFNDYRNKYLGNWKFAYIIRNCNNFAAPCDTTRGEFIGTISYDRKGPRNAVDIQYTSIYHRLYGIDKNGVFTDCSATGEFSGSTKVSFVWVTRMECGGGHSIGSYTVTGEKQ